MVIRLGIIGLSADPSAWATAAHVAPLKGHPLSEHYKITAVATSSLETAKAAAKAHGIPVEKAYCTPEDVARDSDVDMIVVSVKVPLHKELTMPALHAGKDVFVEWPLANGVAQAEEMAALAKKKGVKNLVGLQVRAGPVIVKAREIIASRALGRIVSTTLTTSTAGLLNLPAKASYMRDPKSGASVISIPVGHTLDALCFLLGEFKYLNATTSINFPEVQFLQNDGSKGDPVPRKFADSVAVQGVLESGTTASFAFNITTPGTPDHLTWIIAGEKGSLKMESDGALLQMASTRLLQYTPDPNKTGNVYADGTESPKWEEIKLPPPSGYFGGVGELYAAFAEGKTEVLVDFEEAVKRHKMVEAIFRSAEKGTRESYI